MTNENINPVEAAVKKQTTSMLMACLREFEGKGYKGLDDDECYVEGVMLQELLDRGFVQFCDTHVDNM